MSMPRHHAHHVPPTFSVERITLKSERVAARTSGGRRQRAHAAVILAACLVTLLSGCRPSAASTPKPAALVLATSSRPPAAPSTSTPSISEAPSLAALPAPLPIDQLEGTCPLERNLVQNGEFEESLEGWAARYGALRHTLKTYTGGPGAGLLVTSTTGPDGGKLALAGQCIDLVDGAGGPQALTVEAYLAALPETESVSLSVFFHAGAGCTGEVLQVVGPPTVTADSSWTFATGDFAIPPEAAAADVVIRAVSQTSLGRALIDRLCAYPSTAAN